MIRNDCGDPGGDDIHHPSNNHTMGHSACNWTQADGGRWREAVFERDDHTCQQCDIRGGALQAHHIKPVRCYPWLAVEIDNGITLCEDCHDDVDDVHRLMMIEAPEMRQ